MRKVLSSFRSRNHTAVYLVIRDGATMTMEVWRMDAPDNSMTHCRTFAFEPDPNVKLRSRSETTASRAALSLADALSRMTPSEAIKQADNLRQFGEVR
jgi:hypothetical protein